MQSIGEGMELAIGIVICAAAVWLFLVPAFRRVNFVWDYDRAEEQDMKRFRDGMMLEEAHRNRDRVMKRARMD